MSNPMKRIRERGIPLTLARKAMPGLSARHRLTMKNKPIMGLEGIEDRLGEQWFRDRELSPRAGLPC